MLHSQIEKHLDKVNPKGRPILNRHRYVAHKLMEAIIDEAPYQKQLPSFTYEELKKKPRCPTCYFSEWRLTQRSSTCLSCLSKITIEELVIQQVEDFKLLFPDKRVTRNSIHDWCGGVIPDRRIQIILRNNYKKRGLTSGTLYL